VHGHLFITLQCQLGYHLGQEERIFLRRVLAESDPRFVAYPDQHGIFAFKELEDGGAIGLDSCF
jgi:hypothetical protein